MTTAAGRLIAINTSDGGVPKRPRAEAVLDARGVAGDRQQDLRHHGGPQRAVCLYSFDLLRALQREGHRPTIGSLGENLTVQGVDWNRMSPGASIAIGEHACLEVTGFAVPCRNLWSLFTDRRIDRISETAHPGWSRVYARVLRGGPIRMGDRVTVAPGIPGDPSAVPVPFEGNDVTGLTHARRRVTRTASFEVTASPAEAFSLFTPEGERRWVPGWEPDYLHPVAGPPAAGTMFVTRHDGAETFWLVQQLSQADAVAEYARATPSSSIGIVRVTTGPSGPTAARVTVTCDLRALSDEGDAALIAFDDAFDAMITGWRARIQACLQA